jgi:lipopolysaccharide export system permease protein
MLAFQIFRIMKIVIMKGVDLSIIYELIGHVTMTFFPIVIPVSTFLAVFHTLNRKKEDSEILAMRSFGFTKWQLFLPILMNGLLIATVLYFLNSDLIPYSKKMFKNTVIYLTSQGPINDIKQEAFFTDIPNVTLFAQKVEDGGNKFEKIFIYSKDKNGEGEKVIVAREGKIYKIQGKNASPGQLKFYVKDGNILRIKGGTEKVEKIIFDEYEFPLPTSNFKPGYVSKDSMKSMKVLKESIKTMSIEKKSLGKNHKNKKKLNLLDKRLTKSRLEYWSRINGPLQVLCFVLVGFALGINRMRIYGLSSSTLGIFFLIFYYVIYFFGLGLARKNAIYVPVAVFMPTFLSLSLGGFLFSKLDWEK